MMKRIIAVLLVVLVINSSTAFVPQANAWSGFFGMVYDAANAAINGASLASTVGGWATAAANWASQNINSITLAAAKIAAIMAIQQLTAMFIGGGEQRFIRNYNDYLYVSPSQTALKQMDSFFASASKGRISSANYEGIGPNYDSYLANQAKASIVGKPFQTDIQNQVKDPAKLFSEGNMKGWMSFFKCANNTFCYSMTAQNQYNQNLTKAQEIAKLQQVNGFLPQIQNGRVTSPASMAENALKLVDQVGTSMIVQAKVGENGLSGALMEIASGSAITLGGRLVNYSIADDKTKAKLATQYSQMPTLSASYSSSSSSNKPAPAPTTQTYPDADSL